MGLRQRVDGIEKPDWLYGSMPMDIRQRVSEWEIFTFLANAAWGFVLLNTVNITIPKIEDDRVVGVEPITEAIPFWRLMQDVAPLETWAVFIWMTLGVLAIGFIVNSLWTTIGAYFILASMWFFVMTISLNTSQTYAGPTIYFAFALACMLRMGSLVIRTNRENSEIRLWRERYRDAVAANAALTAQLTTVVEEQEAMRTAGAGG